MNLGALAVNNKTVVWFAAVVIFFAGIAAFDALPQLEDPNFTVKTAVVTTTYPGATAKEVELEVTDRIEQAVMEMKEIRYVESMSRTGFSMIRIEMLPEYWSDKLPQIFDELRRKVRKAEGTLPPGAGTPQVFDDYGQVFGLLLAITGDGFDYPALERYAKDLRKELSRVQGVARVDFWGLQEKVIHLDVAQSQLANIGVSEDSIAETLRNQNMVVDAGAVDVLDHRLEIRPSGEFRSPRDIRDLTLRPSLTDAAQVSGVRRRDVGSELIRIADIGTVSRGLREPPAQFMRINGQPAIGLAMAPVTNDNIVQVGRRIDERLDELLIEILPVGIDVHRVHWQSDVVDGAVLSFLDNFIESLLIVLIVVAIPMGWRLALIIGTNLVLTIMATFVIMSLWSIELHRISLGALIIALGMMVDNAIVVADEMTVKIQQGVDRSKAAIEAAGKHQVPLLGATVIAVMAFFPIAMSSGDTGEYCQHLFYVAGGSLIASWLLALTVTPLQCMAMLPEPKANGADPYAGSFYQRFQDVIGVAIRFRWLTIAAAYGLLVLSLIGFGFVEQLFFPNSSMPKFMIDYYAPQGTRIQDVSAEIRDLENELMDDERVETVATFVGAGPPRFYLPVQPEDAMSNYAQLIVNVADYETIPEMAAELDAWVKERYPNATVPVRLYTVGPGKTWQLETRISGPAVADPEALRAIASKGAEVLETSPDTAVIRTDWQQRIQRLVPEYNRERARWSAVTREDLARTTKRAYDGIDVGLYREGDDLIPIVMRYVEEERRAVDGMPALQVRTPLSTDPVPIAQVTDGVRPEWVDGMIWRRDRRRTMKLQANPVLGVTLPTLREQIEEPLFDLALPPGYTLEWGGLTEDERLANAQLIPGVIPAVIIMLLVMVMLFNSVREPMIIILTIPLGLIGVVLGLFVTGFPFGFIALLGILSLAGMMIKNVIVLLDEIRSNKAGGLDPHAAVVNAAVSRLRPVLLTSATTFLGVLPLITDVLWSGLSVSISGGLLVGAIMTMVFVPTLYATVFNIHKEKKGQALRSEPEPA